MRQDQDEDHRQADQIHGGRRGTRCLGFQGHGEIRFQAVHEYRGRGQDRFQLDDRGLGDARLGHLGIDRYTNKGPHYGKQWKVPIEYKKYKETWKRNYGKDTYIRYRIQGGKYKVPSGGAVGKYGKDVSNKDGSGGYYKSPHSHRAWVARGSNFQLGKNRSIKWSGAVSAFGVKLGASTQYDTDHKQRITMRHQEQRGT